MKTMILIPITSIMFWRNNMIMMLLSIEMLIIIIIPFMISKLHSLHFTLPFFLSIMIMSSTLGLSFLVNASRSNNSSSSSLINIMEYDNYTSFKNHYIN